MTVLVIGGTRFLGFHLVRRLLEDGHQVTLFNRGLTADEFGSRVHRIRGDRKDHRGFVDRLRSERFDVVADMIAYEASDSAAAVEAFGGRVGHFIHISTGAVYFVTRDFPCPLREEDFDRPVLVRPGRPSDVWLYGLSKRQCEDVLRNAHQEHGFPVTVVRLPIVIGERDHTLRAFSYILRILDGRPMILPDAGLCPSTSVYQEDFVRALATNLGNPASFGQAYNLAQPEIVTLRAFMLKAAEVLGRSVDLVDIPSDVLEKSGLGTGFSPYSLRRPFVLSTDKARRDLGFEATPFDLWMRRTVEWYAESYRGGPPENYRSREREVEFAELYRAAVSRLG